MVSERAKRTTPFTAMEVLERANELDDVIHLEVGEPDFPTPETVTEAATAALHAGHTGYTSSRGKPELRQAIADYYDRQYGVDIPTDRIIVTAGSSPALQLAFATIVDPGEEVVLTDPYYACYPNFVRQVGGQISTVSLSSDDDFEPQVSAFADVVSEKTRALLLNSPANPTGAVMSGSTLSALVDRADQHDATVISDEVYHGLSYDDTEHTVLEYTDDAFVLDGFSKRFSMTGWRLGWMVAPPEYADTINRIAQNTLICAPNFVQDAGVAALETATERLPTIRETYRQRRNFLLEEVEKWGMSMHYTPGGAYYLLIDVSDLPGDAYDASSFFLEEAGVAMTPGPDFGSNAEHCLRVSYANSMENLAEASRRIQAVLETVETPVAD